MTFRKTIFGLLVLASLTACALDTGRPVHSQTAEEQSSDDSEMQDEPPVPTAMDTFRALAPPEGLKFAPLFAEKLNSDSARLDRLEKAVQDVRDDVDTMAPALVHVATGVAVKELPEQLAAANPAPTNLKPEEMAPPPAAAPAAAPPVAAEPPSGIIKAYRFADYPTYTRFVLDADAKLDLLGHIENKRTLVIPLGKADWKLPPKFDANSAQLISGYRVENGNLYVDLMYAATIKLQQTILPSAINSNYRFVVDLFSADIHKP